MNNGSPSSSLITSYSIHYTKLYSITAARSRQRSVGRCRGWLNYAASEQIVLRVHHMRCEEIPHRCVRRKYRIRRHYAFSCATVGKGDRCGPLRYYASWRKGMCCKAIKLGNAGFPSHDVVKRRPVNVIRLTIGRIRARTRGSTTIMKANGKRTRRIITLLDALSWIHPLLELNKNKFLVVLNPIDYIFKESRL